MSGYIVPLLLCEIHHPFVELPFVREKGARAMWFMHPLKIISHVRKRRKSFRELGFLQCNVLLVSD
jgi:hypothetical protein